MRIFACLYLYCTRNSLSALTLAMCECTATREVFISVSTDALFGIQYTHKLAKSTDTYGVFGHTYKRLRFAHSCTLTHCARD